MLYENCIVMDGGEANLSSIKMDESESIDLTNEHINDIDPALNNSILSFEDQADKTGTNKLERELFLSKKYDGVKCCKSASARV